MTFFLCRSALFRPVRQVRWREEESLSCCGQSCSPVLPERRQTPQLHAPVSRPATNSVQVGISSTTLEERAALIGGTLPRTPYRNLFDKYCFLLIPKYVSTATGGSSSTTLSSSRQTSFVENSPAFSAASG